MLHCVAFKHLTSVEEVEDGLVYLSYTAFTRVFFLVFFLLHLRAL